MNSVVQSEQHVPCGYMGMLGCNGYEQIDGENYCLGDIIEDKKDDDIHPLIMRYLDSLTGNQRRVAELLMQGHDNQSIKSVLNLSDGRFNMIYKRMRSERKVEPLKKLKGAYINER